MNSIGHTHHLPPGLSGRITYEDTYGDFDGYVNEDKDMGLQDHGGHVQQQQGSQQLRRALVSLLVEKGRLACASDTIVDIVKT